jgi:hypothetical protein
MLKEIRLTPEIAAVARNVVWFEDARTAVADPARFLAYAMTYGDHADIRTIRNLITDDELRFAIENAPPGIFDARSWAYWNLMLGRYPAPPMPRRRALDD